MLGDYDVKYMPCTAVKGQVLADFVVEFTKSIVNDEKGVIGVLIVLVFATATWEVYTNGAANWKGLGVGIVLIAPKKLVMEKSLRLGFLATNNEAKYEVLLVGMAIVKSLGEKS